jgi:hypothetical protein
MELAFGLLAAVAAFTVSATFGLGGSLILVPALSLALGTKEGVALAALLLALNNVPKCAIYRRTIPWRTCASVAIVSTIGVAVGAIGLVALPERAVQWGVVAVIATTLLWELAGRPRPHRVSSPGLAAASGLTSGLAGTSGPLKGLALRTLELPKAELVGAASVVSLAGDATKTAVFTEAGILTASGWATGAALVPIMIACTMLGRHINVELQERVFRVGFWTVMVGYGARLVILW